MPRSRAPLRRNETDESATESEDEANYRRTRRHERQTSRISKPTRTRHRGELTKHLESSKYCDSGEDRSSDSGRWYENEGGRGAKRPSLGKKIRRKLKLHASYPKVTDDYEDWEVEKEDARKSSRRGTEGRRTAESTYVEPRARESPLRSKYRSLRRREETVVNNRTNRNKSPGYYDEMAYGDPDLTKDWLWETLKKQYGSLLPSGAAVALVQHFEHHSADSRTSVHRILSGQSRTYKKEDGKDLVRKLSEEADCPLHCIQYVVSLLELTLSRSRGRNLTEQPGALYFTLETVVRDSITHWEWGTHRRKPFVSCLLKRTLAVAAAILSRPDLPLDVVFAPTGLYSVYSVLDRGKANVKTYLVQRVYEHLIRCLDSSCYSTHVPFGDTATMEACVKILSCLTPSQYLRLLARLKQRPVVSIEELQVEAVNTLLELLTAEAKLRICGAESCILLPFLSEFNYKHTFDPLFQPELDTSRREKGSVPTAGQIPDDRAESLVSQTSVNQQRRVSVDQGYQTGAATAAVTPQEPRKQQGQIISFVKVHSDYPSRDDCTEEDISQNGILTAYRGEVLGVFREANGWLLCCVVSRGIKGELPSGWFPQSYVESTPPTRALVAAVGASSVAPALLKPCADDDEPSQPEGAELAPMGSTPLSTAAKCALDSQSETVPDAASPKSHEETLKCTVGEAMEPSETATARRSDKAEVEQTGTLPPSADSSQRETTLPREAHLKPSAAAEATSGATVGSAGCPTPKGENVPGQAMSLTTEDSTKSERASSKENDDLLSLLKDVFSGETSTRFYDILIKEQVELSDLQSGVISAGDLRLAGIPLGPAARLLKRAAVP